jgi:Domain of unknown function (DUF4136)
MNTKTIFLALSMAVVGMWGCYPGTVSVSELDTVLTIYDEEEDFSRFLTFHMPDTIIAIGDEDNESNDQYDQQMLDKIRNNLIAKGYESIDDISVADLVITVEKSNSELLVGWNPCPGCWCGYWCWYPGWPWYGGGYNPYYPGGGIVYSYPIGTLFISMFDPGTEMGMNVVSPWDAAINGLLSGSDQQILTRIDKAIDQAFEQSPYLGR